MSDAQIAWLNSELGMVQFVWVVAGAAIFFTKEYGYEPPRLATWLFHELKPFYIPALLGGYFTSAYLGGSSWWNAFFLVLGTISWFLMKDVDDDDRWKRRLHKLGEKVQIHEHKLVVVNE